MKQRTTSHYIAQLITTITLVLLGFLGIVINAIVFFSWYSGVSSRDQWMIDTYYNDEFLEDDEILEEGALFFPIESRNAFSESFSNSFNETWLPNLYKTVINGYEDYYIISTIDGVEYAKWVTENIMLQRTLLLALGILLLLLGIGLYFIARYAAKRALRDVQTISEHIQATTNETLEHPLEIKHLSKDDELQPIIQGLNRSNKSLARYIDTIKQFIAGVSHEFRTPLAIIQGKIQLAKAKNDATDVLDVIEHQGKTMQSLLDTLLLLTRIEHDTPIETAPIHLHKHCNEFITTYEEKYKDKHIITQINGDHTLDAHPGLVTVILKNLLDNAYKYSPKHGTITIKIDATSFSVHNQSTTFDASVLKHMFTPFWQHDQSKHTDGFGLGLALVKQAVDTLGRSIDTSIPQGGGCLITTYFSN